MNELTKKIQEVLVPKAALIAYELKDTAHSASKNYYLELRPINEKGHMEGAIPVTVEFLDSLLESYKSEKGIAHGRIPRNMLWCDVRKGLEKFIWYNPPQRRQMYFKECLGIADGEFNVPGIIYRVRQERLEVFAYKGEVPDENTALYKAPFFNVSNGNVCLGTSSLEEPEGWSFEEVLAYWEKRFWYSEFTQLGGNTNPTANNLVIVTENARNKPFDYGELKPMDITLKKLLA